MLECPKSFAFGCLSPESERLPFGPNQLPLSRETTGPCGPLCQHELVLWTASFATYLAMAQNPNRFAPNERPNPTTKVGYKMGGAPTPKWDPIGFDAQPYLYKSLKFNF